MDQHVGTGLKCATGLVRPLGMHPNRKSMLVRGMDHCKQCRVVEQRPTAVQHEFDHVVRMCDGILDRAYAVCWSRKFTNRALRSPDPTGGVPTYCRQERSGDPNAAAGRRMDLPAARDARHPAKIMYLNDRGVRQRCSVNKPEVDMSVDKTGHHSTGKLRYAGVLHSCPAECHRAQLTVNRFYDRRSESMADPQIVNGKPHGYLPNSVRTA
jgi:hypothetical protein